MLSMRALALRAASALCLLAAGALIVAAGLPDRRMTGQLGVIGVIGVTGGIRPGQTPIAPEVGALAPPIEGVDLRAGTWVSLAARRGQPVIVNFWASWCGPCREELPILQAASARVAVIGVSYADPPQNARAFAESLGVTYPLLADPDGQIAALYQLRGIPTTLFLDRDGIIRHIALRPVTQDEIERLIGPFVSSLSNQE